MFRKICDILVGILIAALAIIAGLLILPRCFGCQSMAVLSGSMEPEISVGSIVFVKEVEPETLEVGDVITYQIGSGTMVTHRIQEVLADEDAFITKGDANEVEDGAPVIYSSIVGKEVFHIPYLGYVSIYAQTPIGIMAICGLVIVLILLVFLPDVFKKEDETEKKKK